MIEYETTLQGGPYTGVRIKFDVNNTPTTIQLDKHRYVRAIKKFDHAGPWEPINLDVYFVYRSGL